jgi:hypothetical protein
VGGTELSSRKTQGKFRSLRAVVGPVQLLHYDGGTIPSDRYPVMMMMTAEIK